MGNNLTEIEISKNHPVYKLLAVTGGTDFYDRMPDNSCTILLMIGWRVVLAVILALIFVSGWSLMLFGSPPLEGFFPVVVGFLAAVETLAIIVAGVIFGIVKIIDRFEEIKKDCPRILWTKE